MYYQAPASLYVGSSQVPDGIKRTCQLSCYVMDHLGVSREQPCTCMLPGGQRLRRRIKIHRAFGSAKLTGSLSGTWPAIAAALGLQFGHTLSLRPEWDGGELLVHLRNLDAGDAPAAPVVEEEVQFHYTFTFVAATS